VWTGLPALLSDFASVHRVEVGGCAGDEERADAGSCFQETPTLLIFRRIDLASRKALFEDIAIACPLR